MPLFPVEFELMLVTARFSVSPPVSFAITPAPAFAVNVAFSFTLPVSLLALGPTPVTDIASTAVSVSFGLLV